MSRTDEENLSPSLDTDLADRLASAVIAASVHCRGCGYDLQGLATDGYCPECGLARFESLQAIVDPDASRLPKLLDPKGVGNGLLWFMLCALLGVLALVAPPLIRWFVAAVPYRWDWMGIRIPQDLPLVGAVVVLAGLWSVYKLKPGPGGQPTSAVWRDIWFMTIGIVAWALLAFALWLESRWGVAFPGAVDPVRTRINVALCVASMVGLLGVGGVLRTIGLRSRAYRSSHAARQSVLAMVAAIVAVAVGQFVRVLVAGSGAPAWLSTVGTIIVSVSMLMVVIGLLYLVVNAWWIRSALRRPPPAAEELLLPRLPPDTHVPGDDEP